MNPSTLPRLALVALALVACDEDPLAPAEGAPAPDGIDFGLAEGTFGAHHAGQRIPSGNAPLAHEFAVAVPDSLDGLVLLGYDERTSNLFILQVAAMEVGTYECGPVETAASCHARLFEKVREEEGAIMADGRLDLTEGRIELDGLGPDDVRGTFEARFDRTAGEGGSTLEVFHGTFLVDLLEDDVEIGGLECLIRLAVGATDCAE